jgi:glycosyltransferase involved in cell wall biosynthesis
MITLSDPKISVIIIVKDEEFIHDTLVALKEQCDSENAECVVIDASEGRIDHIRNQHTWVKWFDFQTPPGLNSTISLQRNTGIRVAKSPIIMFCDAGNIPEKDWVHVLSAPILSGKHSFVGGPLIFFHNGKDIAKRNWAENDEEVQYPTCGNMAFTRSAFDKTSGFNAKLLVAEDDDFSWALKKRGIQSATVASAVMRMDIGNRRRRFKRSWRYGKGIVNLLAENPDLRSTRFIQNPDILLYPALLLLYPTFFFLGISHPIFVIVPFAITTLIFAKNRKDENWIFTHLEHFAYAAGTITEIVQKFLRRFRLPVIMQYPNDNSTYIEKLISSLNQNSSVTSRYPEPTKSASLNILLTPLLVPFLKMRGVKVLNIHWLVGKWQLHWAKARLPREILWFWFKFWIATLRFWRIKIVYTVHDLKFHSQIFPDDQKAISSLIYKTDHLVFLNEYSDRSVERIKIGQGRTIIPEGPIAFKQFSSRSEIRKKLNVEPGNYLLILIGILESYKGIDNLLLAAENLPSNISIRIAGNCRDPYKSELVGIFAPLKEKRVDIDINFGFMPDELFSDYLHAADIFIYPCREINNSGSLNAALTAGLPLIVPDMEELEWIPDNCKILLPPSSNPVESIRKTFEVIADLSVKEIEQLKTSTAIWAKSRSWEKCSQDYISIYRRLLND